ncbi:MAG TPA: hypothetical protein VHS58_23085 [Acetobacteraceae bacterium]|nr:hypothetical protein [Acetobacteraceae bacterium]
MMRERFEVNDGPASLPLLREPTGTSPLVAYGLAGLRHCWMPERGTWSHKFHLDGRKTPNESVPHSDLYYSLNVLLGFARVRGAVSGEPYDIPVLFRTLCEAASGGDVRKGACGMALWAAAELDLDTPGAMAGKLRGFASDISPLASWTAQDVGLTLSGAAAQAHRDPSWRPLAKALRDLLLSRFCGPGALFHDSGSGPRRQFATFATQVYVALALYQYAALAQDAQAVGAANACVRKLLELQGPLGEWPWFYRPGPDRVLDFYEVYSVHQHGMAPALLHHAVRHEVPGAREAIVKGFEWLFGRNELGVTMLVPELSLMYRSQARRGSAGRRSTRLLRAGAKVLTGRKGVPAGAGALRLTQEMRSYEYGWLLWSFGDRADYPELTHRAEFVA